LNLKIHLNSEIESTKTDPITPHHSPSLGLAVKGGPETLEKESHEFLGSKRDDRFSNPFFEMVPKACQGSFFVPALA